MGNRNSRENSLVSRNDQLTLAAAGERIPACWANNFQNSNPTIKIERLYHCIDHFWAYGTHTPARRQIPWTFEAAEMTLFATILLRPRGYSKVFSRSSEKDTHAKVAAVVCSEEMAILNVKCTVMPTRLLCVSVPSILQCPSILPRLLLLLRLDLPTQTWEDRLFWFPT